MDRNHPRAREAVARALPLAALLGVTALAAGTPTTSGAFHDTARFDLALVAGVVASGPAEPSAPADDPVPVPPGPAGTEGAPEALPTDDGVTVDVVEPTPDAVDDDSAT